MAETINRYEILDEIGQGGFATVFRAKDTVLERLVALKELKSVLLRDTNWVERFRREGRTIARLDHPHIVPVYDIYETGSRLFIVMRLVNGPSLEERISDEDGLPWTEVVEITKAVAEGLDYAYEQGILHRDLKPANILLDQERGAMLTDFGMAKMLGETSSSLTGAGGVVGTPHYIAPEIWEGQGTSRQSDIYALGCLVWEMVVGEKVFQGETPPAVMMAHFQPLALPREWPGGTPPGLVPLLQKALARRPAERYTTAGELAKALAALASPTPAQKTPSEAAPFIYPSGDPAAMSEASAYLAALASTPSAPPAGNREEVGWSLPPSEAEDEVEPWAGQGKWKGFLAHLGPYLIVNGALVGIYLLTTPGGYPWFIWPALGWGVGLAFHLMALLLDEMKSIGDKWHGFLAHFGSYAIIMIMLVCIYLLTNPGGYPWFIWPALGWGAAVLIHLWSILLSGGDYREVQEGVNEAWRASREEMHAARRQSRKERKAAKHEARKRGKTKEAEAQASRGAGESGYSPALQSSAESRGIVALSPTLSVHLAKARTYQAQIEALLKATTDHNVYGRLQELSDQIQEWIEAVETLAQRVAGFQQNKLIQHDLENVPQAIAKLEAQLAGENDPDTRAELERTLASRRNQLAALQQLQRTMKRAEIKIESTLSSIGTIYSQMLISQSTDHVADYSRLSADVDEEVRTLQDHLEALEEVRLGGL